MIYVLVGCARYAGVQQVVSAPNPPPFSASGTAVTPDRWWTAFGDDGLNQRVEEALAGNYSLAAARQRLQAARALARREASDLFGDLNGIVGITGTFGPGSDSSRLQWGLDGTYPIDLWGEIESRVEAERLRSEAARLDYQAISLDLAAEIAQTWFTLIEAHAQVQLLDEQIQTNRTGLEIQSSGFGLGLFRSPDVLRQWQLLEGTLEQSVVEKTRIELLEHQLAELLGRMPQTAGYYPGFDLPQLPPLPATGIPADVLQRRPDIRREFVAIQAADRDLASAISDQYPRLNLSGALLNVAEQPEAVFRDWFVSVGGQLVAPLLDGGQRRAEVDRRTALKAELFNRYQQAVLSALREVEDSLAQEKNQRERIKHLEKQVELAGEASNQLRQQYLIGDVDYLDVLSAITGQQRLQRQLLSAQLELVLIRVALYRALAGEFDTRPNAPVSRPAVVQQEFDVILNFEEADVMQNLQNAPEFRKPESDSTRSTESSRDE